jgi:ribonuclease P protein component
MIWRIRDRRTFERFRRDGRRVRVGPLWMSVIADPAAVPPRVAFAVGRAVGNAPLRNRLRRRLRALARDHADDLVPGWYLIGADASFAWSPYVEADAQFVEAAQAAFGADSPRTEVSPRSTGHEDTP